jgi:uncharacterized protein (TIGR02391 family)
MTGEYPDSLHEALPDSSLATSLPVEELAGILLSLMAREDCSQVYEISALHNALKHPGYLEQSKWPLAKKAIAEAWWWLVSNGLLVPSPSQSSTFFEVTRLGQQVAETGSFADYRKAAILPKILLHESISDKVWPTFIRGDYDVAVFQAFKEVEVSVRAAGGYDAKSIGIALMREAFHKTDGKLTDLALPEGEREALGHLFAGAIGSYKNPQSHRTVEINDPIEAAQVLMLASHLLGIIDDRAKPKN